MRVEMFRRLPLLLLLLTFLVTLSKSGYTFSSGHTPPKGYNWDSCYWSEHFNEWRYRCNDGLEILCDLVCDYLPKCSLGEDEEHCPICDGDNYGYHCELSTDCISEGWLCDGITDCPLKSDEDPAFCEGYRISHPPSRSPMITTQSPSLNPTWETTWTSREGHDDTLMSPTLLTTQVPTLQPSHQIDDDWNTQWTSLIPTQSPIGVQSPKESRRGSQNNRNLSDVSLGDSIYLGVAGMLFMMILILSCCVCAIISKTGAYKSMLESMKTEREEQDPLQANRMHPAQQQCSNQNPLSLQPPTVLDDALMPPVMFFDSQGFVRKGTPQQSRLVMESLNQHNDDGSGFQQPMKKKKKPGRPPTILTEEQPLHPLHPREEASLSPPRGWSEWYSARGLRSGIGQNNISVNDSSAVSTARSILRRPWLPHSAGLHHRVEYPERRHSSEEKAYCLPREDSLSHSTDDDDDFRPVMSADPGNVSRLEDGWHGQRTVLGVDTSLERKGADSRDIWDRPQGLFGLRFGINQDEEFLEENW